MALVRAASRGQWDEVLRLLRAGPRLSLPPPTWKTLVDSHSGWSTLLVWTVAALPHWGLTTSHSMNNPLNRIGKRSTPRGSMSRSPFAGVGPSPKGASPRTLQTSSPESKSSGPVAQTQVAMCRRRTAPACRSVSLSLEEGLCGGPEAFGLRGLHPSRWSADSHQEGWMTLEA